MNLKGFPEKTACWSAGSPLKKEGYESPNDKDYCKFYAMAGITGLARFPRQERNIRPSERRPRSSR
jgi:hypothetical protein